MEPFVLTCCSTADMEKNYFERRNIPYVCFHVNLDGKDYMDDLGKSISFEEFYKKIQEGALAGTSQVNVEEYIEFFEPFLKNGQDILHISLSSGISGTFNSANIAREELLEIYPDRQILLVDSLGASSEMCIRDRMVTSPVSFAYSATSLMHSTPQFHSSSVLGFFVRYPQPA